MECKHCNSSWNSSQTVSTCPFCGKYLLSEVSDNMTLSEGITKIVSEYGIEILRDSKRLISLIMDYVRACDKEKKLFRIACECEVLKMSIDIKKASEDQRALLIQKAIKKLEDNAFLSTDNAEYIVSLVMEGLEIPYKTSKQEVEEPPVTITQPVQVKEIANPIETSVPSETESNDVRLNNIVLSNASSSPEDRDQILEIGRKKLINKSFNDGFKYVQYAAKKGSMPGAILLGYCYDAGLGVKQDRKIAEAYYRQGTLSNPEFKSYYQQKYGIGKELFDAAAKAAEGMLKISYIPTKTVVTEKKPVVSETVTKKPETIQQTSNSLFQSIKGMIFKNEKDKDNHLWSIVNANQRPSKDECGAILNLGRRLLKSGNATDGIKLIKYTAQYGYDYGALLLAYCYDNGIGVPKDYNIASAYYGRAGVSGGADESYKKHGWDDSTHRARAYSVAEKIYNEKI